MTYADRLVLLFVFLNTIRLNETTWYLDLGLAILYLAYMVWKGMSEE